MNAADFLLSNGLDSDKAALVTSQEDFSYSGLKEASIALAAWLDSAGIRKGDRILIIGDSSFFWVATYLAALRMGAVAVPVPGTVKARKLDNMISRVNPGAVFIQKKNHGVLRGISNLPEIVVTDEEPGISSDGSTDLKTILGMVSDVKALEKSCDVNDGRDLASIMFTSGSTGEPNGVMISHRNIIANTDSIIRYMKLTEKDRVMAILPFHYCYGLSLLHTHLKVGGSVVIENSFMFPEVILNRMEETECTGFAGVPSTYQILLRNSTFAKRGFPHLRYVQQAGGKLPDVFIRELQGAIPGKEIFIMYGQTEATARLSYLPPRFLNGKLGSIGKGIPGVKLSVANGSGKPVSLGEVGEIVAEGDNIGLGYWKDEDATRSKFRDGKLFTGDLARVDEEGFIFVVDRASDFLKCGGLRVSSKEIEDVVLKFQGTIEAAVVRQPDVRLGEAVRLYVVHKDGNSVEKELKNHCTANLEWSFTPRKMIFLDSLPRTNAGKVDKQRLRPEVFDVLHQD